MRQLQGVSQADARLGAVIGCKKHQLGRVLPDGAGVVLLRNQVVVGNGGMEDRIEICGHRLPVGVRGVRGLGNRETLLGHGRTIVAGLRVGARSAGVKGLAAQGLFDGNRDVDGLHVVGVDLQKAACRAQKSVRLVRLLVAVDHLIVCGRLGRTLRVGLKKTLQRGALLRRIVLGAGVLIAVELGRILNLDGLAVSLKCGRGNQAHACQCHRRCKD